MAADLIITGLIGWGLYKSRTGWSHTDKVVKNLIMYVFLWEVTC